MKALEKQRQLIDELNGLEGSDRAEKKALLNAMIQAEIDIKREERRLEELKVDLAIASNT